MTDAPLDPSVLAELIEAMGDDFASELVETFLDEAPGMIAELKAALSGGDAEGYRRAAHSMKSNANTFGATALAEQARDMELGALPAPSESGDIDALEAALAEAATALRGRLDG